MELSNKVKQYLIEQDEITSAYNGVFLDVGTLCRNLHILCWATDMEDPRISGVSS